MPQAIDECRWCTQQRYPLLRAFGQVAGKRLGAADRLLAQPRTKPRASRRPAAARRPMAVVVGSWLPGLALRALYVVLVGAGFLIAGPGFVCVVADAVASGAAGEAMWGTAV